MKMQLTLTAGSLICLGLSSCITSTVVATAAGVKALGGATSSVTGNVTGLFTGDYAPTNMADKVITFSGNRKDAKGTAESHNDALSFAAKGISTRNSGTQTQVLAYTHKAKNQGIITVSTPAGILETYTLTFDSASSGSYTYVRQGDTADYATGEGTFKVK